ncbi:MAG: riboflavin synthase [Planctomycetota bacterium]|jgi:riboflavin synthase
MFTGLVKAVGEVDSAKPTPEGARLVASLGVLQGGGAQALGGAVEVGDSIAVAGVCLTVVDVADGGARVSFDVVKETLDRTTLGGLAPRARVNLEPALRVGDALGGHFVTGHVDGAAKLVSRKVVGDGAELTFEADAALLQDVVPKGSVAVDGVSLTVARLAPSTFTVAAIPHTLSATTLGDLAPGARVNVETDMLVKAVRRIVSAEGGGLTLDTLRKHGFA